MMFLCRSAKTLGKAFVTHGSSASISLRNVILTLHKVHTSRAVCLTALKGHVNNANHKKGQDTDFRQNRDTWRGFTPNWDHLEWVATIRSSLLKSVQSQGGRGETLTPQFGSLYWLRVIRNGVAGNAPGNIWQLDRRCPTGTIQTTRASSAAAATKQREAGEEQQAVGDKGDEPVLKDTSSSPEKSSGKPDPEPEGGKPNKTQQLKKVFKEYGAVGVSFHITISLMSLGMFYLLVSSGIDMAALLCKLGFSEAMVRSKMAAGTSTFVLAYAIHKLFAPVRISITLVSVPLIVRHFRKIGLFKLPPATP